MVDGRILAHISDWWDGLGVRVDDRDARRR